MRRPCACGSRQARGGVGSPVLAAPSRRQRVPPTPPAFRAGRGQDRSPAGGAQRVRTTQLPTFASDGASVRMEMVVTEPGQQRSKAELTADIRARRRTALVVNVRSRRGRRHYPTVCRQLHHAGLDLLDLHPVADPRRLAAGPRRRRGQRRGSDRGRRRGRNAERGRAPTRPPRPVPGRAPAGDHQQLRPQPRSAPAPARRPADPDRGQGRRRRPRPRRRAALRQPDQPGAVGAGRQARPPPAQADPGPGRLSADRAGAAAPPPAVHRPTPRHRRHRQ